MPEGPLSGFTGQVLAITIGSVLTVIGSWSIQYYRDQRRRYAIRRSLKVDVEGARGRLRLITRGRETEALSKKTRDTILSTKMYDQYLTDLGLLSEKEIEHAAAYYRRVEQIIHYENLYDELQASKDESESESSSNFERKESGLKEMASEAASEAEMEMDDLLESLEEQLDSHWLIPWA